MDFRLPTIPSIASPLAIAELYGLETQPAGERYSIACPTCNSRMWVFSSSVLCENNNCDFLTGDGLDLLLRLTGDQKETSDWLDDVFPTQWTCLGTSHTQVFEAIRARRRMLEFFIRRISPENRTVEEERLMGLVEKNGIDPEISSMTAFPVSKEDMPEFLDLLRIYRTRVSLDDDAHLLIPMFSRHHEIAGFHAWSGTKRELTPIWLSTAKFSYSGLWLDSPMMEQQYLVRAPVKAMIRNSEYRLKSPEQICLGVLYDARAPYVENPLRNSTFLVADEVNGLAEVSAYRRRYTGAKFAHDDGLSPSGSKWPQFSYDLLVRSHVRGEETAKVVLELLNPSESEIFELKRRAAENGYDDLRDTIEQHAKYPVIFDGGKYKIKQTPNGYTYETADGWTSPLTNFTLSFDTNLTFQDSGSVFHLGTMLFDGRKFPITATPGDLQGFKQLNERVLQGAVARADIPSETGLPFISPNKHLQQVSIYLQKLVSGLPCLPGTPHLGWTYERDRFFTSSWMVSGEGVAPPAPLHPDIERIQAYEDLELPEASIKRKLPGDLCELISMVTAAVVRSFLNYRLRPVVLRHDQNSARILPALFKALGQTQPIRFPEKERHLSSFPAYTFYDSPAFRAGSRSPFFVLGGEGKVIQEVLGDDDIEHGTALLRLILQRTAERLLATPEGDVENLFQRRPHILYSNELALEGYHWIAHVLEIPNWIKVPVPYAHLEKELADREPKDIAGMFFYEPARERVHILKKALKGDEVSVGLELKALVDKWEQTPDYFVIDHSHAAALLEHYYGRMISLPSIDPSGSK